MKSSHPKTKDDVNNEIKEILDEPAGAAVAMAAGGLLVLGVIAGMQATLEVAENAIKHPFSAILIPLLKELNKVVKSEVKTIENEFKTQVGKLGFFKHNGRESQPVIDPNAYKNSDRDETKNSQEDQVPTPIFKP